jgi:hypothetical protein
VNQTLNEVVDTITDTHLSGVGPGSGMLTLSTTTDLIESSSNVRKVLKDFLFRNQFIEEKFIKKSSFNECQDIS